MNSLLHLSKVVNLLKEHELDTVYKHLDSLKIEHINSKPKSVRLVDLLRECKQPKDASVLQFKIYGKKNSAAFKKLVHRTRDKIYESLILDNNLNKAGTHAERNRAGYDLRKKMIETEILSARGLSEDVELLYERMLKKAELYEFYDILLEILYMQSLVYAFRYGEKKIMGIEKKIIHFENIRSAVNKSRLVFDRFAARINFSASSKDYVHELQSALNELKSNFETSNSPLVGYFYYLLETELYQQLKDYENANVSLLKLVDLLKKSPSIETRIRLGVTYVNLANNELLLHKFDSGVVYAKQAKEYFSNSQVNTNVAKEIEFILMLSQDKLKKPEELIAEICKSSATQKATFLFYKRTYLHACLQSLKCDFKKSDSLLNEVKEIEKDKEGWNIGIRLLYIMNLVDRKNYEAVEPHLISLKKYLARLRKDKLLSKRYAIILRILQRFMSDNFVFRKTYKRSKKYFDLLQSDKDRYEWSIRGPELIAFHEWFLSRMEFRKFSYQKAFNKVQTN